MSEDEDVQVEKARVKEALTCQCCDEVQPRFSTNHNESQITLLSNNVLNMEK